MISILKIREQFSLFGELRPQPRTAWTGEIPLPESLAEFYEQIGPWGETYHENIGPVGITLSETAISFPPLLRLWKLQAGYRWDASNGQRVADWRDEWLVIADLNADPFILDAQTGQILFARHGEGAWNAHELAPDLLTFVATAAAIGVVFHLADGDLRNDEWELKPEYRAAAILQAAQVLGDQAEAESFFEALEG
ncbi:MAG: hypothetical protein E2591_27000 [Achromobacter sp.]|uniref:SMI1/KNR4 family protein n=1 Tax=Achromobacter sp. TaxID=134375 RepID=UPI0012BFA4BD|nr:SMI1/KNR4 family protein [Achromobacter sp.]MPS81726.1 hypothetical protein [Achromobacter sp.]